MKNILKSRGEVSSAKLNQSGFALVELIVAIAISGALLVWGSKALVVFAEETVAQATGAYMLSGKNALDNYTFQNFDALSKGLAVTGVASNYAPTVAELVSLKYLPSGFPAVAQSGQAFSFLISPTDCPGVTCKLPGLFHSASQYKSKDGRVRYDLATKAAQAAGGYGGLSYVGNESTLTGSTFTVANPLGSIGAVIAVGAYLDTTVYNQFVRISDTRDPTLKGGLTIDGGTTTLNTGLTVNGPTINNGTVTATGPIDTIDKLSNCIRAGVSAGAPSGGGAVYAKNNACLQTILLDGQTGVITAAGGVEVKNSAGVVLASLNPDGTVVATTRTIAPASKVTASFVPNTACAAAAANDIAQNASNPGLVVCRNNVWVPVGVIVGSIGGVCSVDGAAGVDVTGLGLFCQGGLWISNADRMGHFASQDSFVGHHNTAANKPGCASNGVPRIYFSATGGEFSPVAGVRSTYFVTQDTGAQWLLKVVDANGAAVPDGQGLVTTGCWYS
jgi:prepilin-type N-terminal cleavage/methylation domain-containing protein